MWRQITGVGKPGGQTPTQKRKTGDENEEETKKEKRLFNDNCG